MATNTTRKNIFVAWDRMNSIWFRYWANYEEKGKTLSGDASKEHQRKFQREVHFLIRRSCDLEFHQYLNKRLDYTKEKGRKEGLVVRRHMRELTRFILLDKLRQKDGRFATTQDILSSKTKNLCGGEKLQTTTETKCSAVMKTRSNYLTDIFIEW